MPEVCLPVKRLLFLSGAKNVMTHVKSIIDDWEYSDSGTVAVNDFNPFQGQVRKVPVRKGNFLSE